MFELIRCWSRGVASTARTFAFRTRRPRHREPSCEYGLTHYSLRLADCGLKNVLTIRNPQPEIRNRDEAA